MSTAWMPSGLSPIAFLTSVQLSGVAAESRWSDGSQWPINDTPRWRHRPIVCALLDFSAATNLLYGARGGDSVEVMVNCEGDSQNPIHRLLDQARIPWRLPLGDLQKRFGVRPVPDCPWNDIEIRTAHAFVDGLIYPLHAVVRPQFSPFYPSTGFYTYTYFGDDERGNIQRTAHCFARSLGHAEIVAYGSNALRCEWRLGEAAVSLTVLPAAMQQYKYISPLHERDPRLARACSIAIRTGFVPSPSAKERAWLESFVPIRPIPVRPDPEMPPSSFAKQNELEFVRKPGTEAALVFGQIGRSADCNALIYGHEHLYIIALADVVGFRVERLQRAKGSGGSYLHVECRTHYDGVATKQLNICSSEGPDDLNELAREIATSIGKPVDFVDDMDA